MKRELFGARYNFYIGNGGYMEQYILDKESGLVVDKETGEVAEGPVQMSFNFSSTECKEQVIGVLTKPVEKDSGSKQELGNSQGPAEDNFVRIPLSQEPEEEKGENPDYWNGDPYSWRR